MERLSNCVMQSQQDTMLESVSTNTNIQEYVNGNELIENIKKYGNKKANYQPFDGAVSYPLHSQDFVRTGFLTECPTLASRDYKDPKCVCEVKQVGNIQPETNHQSQNVYDENGLAPTVMAGTHGYGMGYVEQCQKLDV